jgi:hypothetical protein
MPRSVASLKAKSNERTGCEPVQNGEEMEQHKILTGEDYERFIYDLSLSK